MLAAIGSGPLPGDAPQEALVFAYTNERRGGEVISGGVIGYFDGERIVGLVELNTSDEASGITQFPYHPVLPAHVAAVRSLVGREPRVEVDQPHVQARVLDGPDGPVRVSGAIRRRLLIRLLLSANQPIPKARLMEDVWEGKSIPSESTLQSQISLVRQILDRDRLVTRWHIGREPSQRAKCRFPALP